MSGNIEYVMNPTFKHILILFTLTLLNMAIYPQLKNGPIPVFIVMFRMECCKKIGDMMVTKVNLENK